MNILNMENKYTTKQIADILGVTDKSVRRYLNSYFSINNGAYEISEKMLNILKKEYDNIYIKYPAEEAIGFWKKM